MWDLEYKESWALKNWCFWTMVLEETLESPSWTSRRSNQSILKEINPEYSLEGLMLKLKQKLKYFGHLMQRLTHRKRPWCWEKLKAGGEEDDRGWNGCMGSLNRWTWVWVNSGIWWWTGRTGVLRFMGSQRVRHDWATELNRKPGFEGIWSCQDIIPITWVSLGKFPKLKCLLPHSVYQ